MPNFSILLILMVTIWTFGKIFRYFKLPVVFGELVGGIFVGPAVLGLIPADHEVIKILSELGIFFMMLHAGLETNPDNIIKTSKKSIFISIIGILIPFISAYYLSLYFGQSHISSLFIGLGVSISSITIASRLFKDCKISKSEVAYVTHNVTIFDDIIALVLFSILLGYAKSGSIEIMALILLIAKIIAFFGITIFLGIKVFPKIRKLLYFGNKGFTLTLIIALLMGLIAESVGLHIMIGAYLTGLFIRKELLDKKVFEKIEDRIYGLSYSFFAPIFFISLSLNLDFTSLKTSPIFLLLIFLIAFFGKIIGGGITAYIEKIKFINSIAIGIALNCRGTIELIIASIGLSMGIIDKNVFSILILVAFSTTIISILIMPLLTKSIKNNYLE